MSVRFVQIVSLALFVWGISSEKTYPCEVITNSCVGIYLNQSSSCVLDLVLYENLDPHTYSGVLSISTPYFNTTEDRTDLIIHGINHTYIKDFYYNPTSGKAVLTVAYPYLKLEGTTTIRFQIPGDEGFNVSSQYFVEYNDVILTTIFNNYQKLELNDSQTFAYIPKLPMYSGGEGLAAAALSNEQVAAFVKAVEEKPDVASLEAFSSRAWAIQRTFIDHLVCDYDPTLPA